MNVESRVYLQKGQLLEHPCYTGKNFVGCSIETMPYSPNREWTAPMYFPFSLDEVIAVHLTNQDARETGILRPQSYIPFFQEETSENGWFFPRETLHFTLNGVVADHRGGSMFQQEISSWKNKRFAYHIPLRSIIDQVISVYTHDTIVLGELVLQPDVFVIDNQNNEKVLHAIEKLGYQPLDIQGVKEFDPAYIMGTKINVNHPVNFASIIQGYHIDGQYIDTGLNNILYLDNMLAEVFAHVSTGNGCIEHVDLFADQINERAQFFLTRYGNDEKKGPAIRRFCQGVHEYSEYLRDYQEYFNLHGAMIVSYKEGKISWDEVTVRNTELSQKEEMIKQRLLWKGPGKQ